jgi:hypothetical protein
VRAQQRGQVPQVRLGPAGAAEVATEIPTEIATGQRQLERQLAQPVREADLAQRQAAGQRAERRAVQRQEPLGERRGVRGHRPPAQLLGDVPQQLGAQVGRERVGVLQHRVHQRPEGGARGQVGHRRRRDGVGHRGVGHRGVSHRWVSH